MGKEMYICVTAFVLENGNDIRRGGIAVPISMVRVGKMMQATKDSYKRVYKPDGSYHYPQNPENRLREKGEWYFKSLELTGSSEGTSKKPKISLLKTYKDIIIPDIERKVVERFSNNGTRKVIVLKQEDGAGLHNDKTYLDEMHKEFWDKRGWMNFNQSSQSPTFNVHDSCVFPMLSKAVSREQALLFGSTLLKGEQLHDTVMKVWNDEANLGAIARAFASHWQIVCAAMFHKGDNDYLKEKGGLSFGIRKTFVTNRNGDGIIPVTLAPEHEGATLTGELLNENFLKGLKYPTPSISELTMARLTPQMLEVLDEYMDKSKLTDEHRDALIRQDYNGETASEGEESEDEEIVEAEIISGEGLEEVLGDISTDDDTESECDSLESRTLGSVNSSKSFELGTEI